MVPFKLRTCTLSESGLTSFCGLRVDDMDKLCPLGNLVTTSVKWG